MFNFFFNIKILLFNNLRKKSFEITKILFAISEIFIFELPYARLGRTMGISEILYLFSFSRNKL